MKYNLTDTEANILKDILRTLGKDEELNNQMAEGLGMSVDAFNETTDAIYSKLGNGRIIVKQ